MTHPGREKSTATTEWILTLSVLLVYSLVVSSWLLLQYGTAVSCSYSQHQLLQTLDPSHLIVHLCQHSKHWKPLEMVIIVIILLIAIISLICTNFHFSRMVGIYRLSDPLRARPQETNSLCLANRKYPWQDCSSSCRRHRNYSFQHAQTLAARHIRRPKKGKWGWLQDVVC